MQACARPSSAASKRIIGGSFWSSISRSSYLISRGEAYEGPLSALEPPPRGQRRDTKQGRRAWTLKFIQKYITSNEGKFSTITYVRDKLGGSHYTVRGVIQELECHERKLLLDDAKAAPPQGRDEFAVGLHDVSGNEFAEHLPKYDNGKNPSTVKSIEAGNDVAISQQHAHTKTENMEKVPIFVRSGGLSCLLKQRRSIRGQKYASFLTQRPFCSGQHRTGDDLKLEVDDKKLNSACFFTKGFCVSGPGDVNALIQCLSERSNECKRKLNINLMKVEFDRDFRPFIAASGLLMSSGIGDVTTAYAHGQLHGLHKKDPLYLTALDVMIRVKGLFEAEKVHLKDHLLACRALVYDDWVNSFGSIEILSYRFGLSGSVRGECDARLTKIVRPDGTVSKLADISGIIWIGGRLVWAEVFEGLPMSDSHDAEVVSALALLMKFEQLNLLDVELWSDSKKAIQLITGEEPVEPNAANRDIYLLLKTARTRFTKLTAVWKRRELMFLADQVLRDGFTIEKALEKWSPYLMGRPIFRICNTGRTNAIIRDEFGGLLENYVHKEESTYFLKAESGDKLAELERVVASLCPDSLYLTIDMFEEKSQAFRDAVKTVIPNSEIVEPSVKRGTTTTLHFGISTPQKRSLVVVWDASTPMQDYYQDDSCVIILVANNEEGELVHQRRISEINVLTYLYLNRAKFQQKKQKKKKKHSQQQPQKPPGTHTQQPQKPPGKHSQQPGKKQA